MANWTWSLSMARACWRLFGVLAMALLCACSSYSIDGASSGASMKAFSGDPGKPRNVFVLLDGTKNDPASRTNVRKLYERVVGAGDPQSAAIYVDGVGTATTPVLEQLLGLGMEPRILKAYDFVAQSAGSRNDNIYIFGFSRGAHEARALAGLIAYAGLPKDAGRDPYVRLRNENAILEIVKSKSDKDYLAAWQQWTPGSVPFSADEIRQRLKIESVPATIAFLGLWDTVPGSAFKDFDECMEQADRRGGDRYKSGSYPPIRRIVHAVSLDEKRSRFHPLLVCPAMNPGHTSISEVWFPGAHADVGGGYKDSHALPELSLRWMSDMLGQSYAALPSATDIEGNPLGTAHWSVGDWPANLMSRCEDRVPPRGARMHDSVEVRTKAGRAEIVMKGVKQTLRYPLSCS